jgi:hypothetical protein
MLGYAASRLEECQERFKIVQVYHKYCPRCYKSSAWTIFPLQKESARPAYGFVAGDDYETRTSRPTTFRELLQQRHVDPYQILNAFEPSLTQYGRIVSQAHFSRPVIALSKPGSVCRDPSMCDEVCVICNGLIDPFADDAVSTEPWPHLRVHRVCCIKCQHPNCDTYLPTIKRCLMPRQLITYCSLHATAEDLDAPVKPPRKAPQPSPPAPRNMQIGASAMHPPAAKTIEKTAPKTVTAPKTIDKMATKVVIRTAGKPPKPNPAQQRRIALLNADRRTPSVAAFFVDAGCAPPAPVEAAPDNRRVIRDKNTSEVIGYWRNGRAYNAHTDEPFREREAPVRTKFDFSPPCIIAPPVHSPPVIPPPSLADLSLPPIAGSPPTGSPQGLPPFDSFPQGLPPFADLHLTDSEWLPPHEEH